MANRVPILSLLQQSEAFWLNKGVICLTETLLPKWHVIRHWY